MTIALVESRKSESHKNPKAHTLVGIGQVAVVARPEQTRAVLGSCIGLVLYHADMGVAALGHIMLAAANGRSDLPGKFADTAIPHMLKLLEREGASMSGLEAKMAGGAHMFGTHNTMRIGEENAKAVAELLEKLQIPLSGQHTGGSKGQRVTFDTSTGELLVEIAGKLAAVI